MLAWVLLRVVDVLEWVVQVGMACGRVGPLLWDGPIHLPVGGCLKMLICTARPLVQYVLLDGA